MCSPPGAGSWLGAARSRVIAKLRRSVANHANPIGDTSRTEREMQARTQKPLFKVGDKAVYPAQGVAEVVSIEEKDIAGQRQKFYVLRILDTNRKIMVPVDKARNVGLRPPISEKEIQEIFAILRERTIAFDNQTWNRRYRGFMDKIKTGSVYDVAEVMRDLYRLKAEKSLSFGERRMLETARALIVKEIAVTRENSEDKVQAEIEKIFETN
jgi:CarD family transcriptional regulator